MLIGGIYWLVIDTHNRTWIKRLARRTICFSKLEKMHDIVIGLLINKVEFGRDIHA
jgi:insertion element IS1 protein InsB